jgi:hypothetical protein
MVCGAMETVAIGDLRKNKFRVRVDDFSSFKVD